MQHFGDGRIAFESMIQEYAAEQDMSFKDVLKWLSGRLALSVAGELLGLPDINEESLNELAAQQLAANLLELLSHTR
ncbi:hypothetical protein [Alicyclobacillus sp. SO9]|uniref:hypothetical protein n=1 Tax=Alicyclobacillus sp. SO9 TaxID=2665646 RepID=UPI0018E87EBA|nr:hypothetical protein [Alicyclobacillus sp. SO9]QQE78086.1 hypothetical protein GI364_19665 [Alicyclobacillus sp. SO9]